MSFEFSTSIDRQEQTFTTTWTWWPDDTLEALDLFLVYFGLNTKCVRPRITATTRKDSRVIAPMLRCLHDKAYRSAICLIHPGRRCPEKRALHWYVTPTMDIKGRLAGAGINIDTVRVVNERRWAFAWQQLSFGNSMSYSAGKNDKLFESDFPTPPIDPVVKHVKCAYKKGQPSKISYEFTKKNNFVVDELGRRIYDPAKSALPAEPTQREGPEL